QGRKAGIAQHRRHLLAERILLGRSEFLTRPLQKPAGGCFALARLNLRKRLHQAVNQDTAQTRLSPIVGGAGRTRRYPSIVDGGGWSDPRSGAGRFRSIASKPVGHVHQRSFELERGRWRGGYFRGRGAISPNGTVAVVGRLFAERRTLLEGTEYKVVPTSLRSLRSAFNAADDQPVGGAGHRDVKQTSILILCGGEGASTLLRHDRDVAILGTGPNDAVRRARHRVSGGDSE